MTIESATTINQLVATNPASGDPKSEGDDHIRLLKSTIQATFPNITGMVTLTQAQLNALAGTGSGTYTPTVTNVSNTSSPAAGLFFYTRVGNIVSLAGVIVSTVTAGSSCVYQFTMPVVSNFGANADLTGMGVPTSGGLSTADGTPMALTANSSNNQATCRFISGSSTTSVYAISAQYVVH